MSTQNETLYSFKRTPIARSDVEFTQTELKMIHDELVGVRAYIWHGGTHTPARQARLQALDGIISKLKAVAKT